MSDARFATLDDRSEVQRICMHPSVRRWTACDGAPVFDAERWLTKGMVVMVDGGCFLANPIERGVYGCHTNLLPEARGIKALRSAREALHLAFINSDAETFMTTVAENNGGASWLTQVMGFRRVFEQPGRWTQGGMAWTLAHWRLDIDDWIIGSQQLGEYGKRFHDRIDPQHAPDRVHDRYVGALGWMAVNGNADKGVRIYNRWARAAGYACVSIIDRDPLTIDAHDFHVVVRDQTLEIKEHEHA